ncbi:MAG TPA: type II secretion system F family protein [Polyangiaceae bacterium]|nr:type II secretion system F family protein [Polyangiaceae bacterium]
MSALAAGNASMWGLKLLGVVALSGGLGLFAWRCMVDPDMALHRAWARYCGSLENKLYRAFVFRPGWHIAVAQVGALVVIATVSALGLASWRIVALLAIATTAGPPFYLGYQLKARVEKISRQVEGFIVAVANALKSRPAVGDAIESVLGMTPNPLRQELELSVKQMRLGTSVEQALVLMSARVGSQQLDTALSALLIGRQVGGNLPTIMETTAEAMREMERLHGVIRTKTAEGKAQMWVLAFFPLLLMVGFNVVSPGYFDVLSETLSGTIATIVAFACWGGSIAVARQILAVDI